MHTPRRRATAIASFALILAPVLSSCGFDYATDRDNSLASLPHERTAVVDVLGPAMVTAATGETVFFTSLSNGSGDEDVALESVTSTEDLTIELEEPVVLAPNGFVNLAGGETPPITVEGEVVAGSYVPVELAFSNGEVVSLKVPVVPNCGVYAEIPGVPTGDEYCEIAPVESH